VTVIVETAARVEGRRRRMRGRERGRCIAVVDGLMRRA
jgi:hypothetical protein